MMHTTYTAVFTRNGEDMAMAIEGNDAARAIAEDTDQHVLVIRQDLTVRDGVVVKTGTAYLVDSSGNSYTAHPDGFDPITRIPRVVLS